MRRTMRAGRRPVQRSRTSVSRGVGLLAATGALCAMAVTPASADPATTWQPDLSRGEGTGVVVRDGTARFDPATAHGAPVEGPDGDAESSADPAGVVPTGLLTLPSRTLERPATEVDSTLVTDAAPGSTATIDVRGRRAGGGWTEWIPATPGAQPGTGSVQLPEASREVQGRIVLTSTGGATPAVREVTLSAAPSSEPEGGPTIEAAPRGYSVFATREGLVGGTTANGHKIANRDRFVALPSRRALSANGKSDYSVKVCAPNGRCAFAPVWDIGPWNTKDDYWNPGPQREMWKDLPQGVPQAQAAFRNGHNGGRDQFGRRPANPAGIDLGDGIFWDALGLKDNSQVHVDYLWTGSVRLSTVRTEGGQDPAAVHAAPDPGSPVVGIAADSADVPVQCRQGTGEQSWLRVGDAQFLPAGVLRDAPPDVPSCGPAADPPAGDAGDAAGGVRSAGRTSAAPAAPAPKRTAPETTAPDSAAQKHPAPHSTGPHSTAPTSTAPMSTAPTSTSPKSTAPATTDPGREASAPVDSATPQAATAGTGAATRGPSSAAPPP